MIRLASAPGALRPRYEVVIVGSGYGGAVAASRLARAGRDVCVLERGREIQPGEFPDTALEAVQDVQAVAGRRHVGPRTALFDLRMNGDISVVQGCGLGGTSLVNANVVLRPDPRVFDDPRWPAALRDGGVLEEDFVRVERMLGATPYPERLARPKKYAALERAAAASGAEFRRLPVAVTFEDRVNEAGVAQKACALCGDCVTGCNHGSKNTLVMNYLPDAKRHGAAIFTQVQVRHLSRGADGWRVHYELTGAGRRAFGAGTMHLQADIVILSAGSLGSTEILLRSEAEGLALSPRLGCAFTGNGDVLAFGYNCDSAINGIGWGSRTADDFDDPCVGPTITAGIDLRGADLDQAMILEEGCVPGALAPFMPIFLAGVSGAIGEDTDAGLLDALQEGRRSISSLVGGSYRGAVGHALTFLAMAHDSSSGRIVLDEGGQVRIDWKDVGREPIFERIHEQVRLATAALGGTALRSPLWTDAAGRRLITVHPLGGCPMADDGAAGVVNDRGQVFAGSGTAVHPGLYVSDGAVLPRSVGINPLLTIGALAERNARLLARDRGWTIDYSAKGPIADEDAARPGLQFTERMTGYVHLGADTWQEGWDRGRQAGTELSFVLTVRIDDVDAMLADPDHRGTLAGTVECAALSGQPLTASRGDFRLFSVDAERVGTRRMSYTMTLDSVEGREYCLHGYKVVRDDPGFDTWADTTTLFVTLHEGGDTSGPVAGRGILRIRPTDFLRQLSTMKAINARTMGEKLRAQAAFGQFFAGVLYDVYGGVFARASEFAGEVQLRKKRSLDLPAPEVHFVTTADGVVLQLTRHAGGPRGPVLLAPGMGTSTLAFSLDSVDRNVVEVLCAAGYDVWLFDHRASAALPASSAQSTLDDIAGLDYPAAIDAVRASTGAADVQVVAHCVASAALLMGLASGRVRHVRSAICSQVGLFVESNWVLKLKSELHLGTVLQGAGVDVLRSKPAGAGDWTDRAMDWLLRMHPTEGGEHCDSPVCRRVRFILGEVYRHDMLNHQTHRALHEIFGNANLSTLRHLSKIVRQGHLLDADGADVYLAGAHHLKLPITFLQGMRNSLFRPEGLERTVEWLRERNGDGWYELRRLDQYGHMDTFIGKDAAADVFPEIVRELERFN